MKILTIAALAGVMLLTGCQSNMIDSTQTTSVAPNASDISAKDHASRQSSVC